MFSRGMINSSTLQHKNCFQVTWEAACSCLKEGFEESSATNFSAQAGMGNSMNLCAQNLLPMLGETSSVHTQDAQSPSWQVSFHSSAFH